MLSLREVVYFSIWVIGLIEANGIIILTNNSIPSEEIIVTSNAIFRPRNELNNFVDKEDLKVFEIIPFPRFDTNNVRSDPIVHHTLARLDKNSMTWMPISMYDISYCLKFQKCHMAYLLNVAQDGECGISGFFDKEDHCQYERRTSTGSSDNPFIYYHGKTIVFSTGKPVEVEVSNCLFVDDKTVVKTFTIQGKGTFENLQGCKIVFGSKFLTIAMNGPDKSSFNEKTSSATSLNYVKFPVHVIEFPMGGEVGSDSTTSASSIIAIIFGLVLLFEALAVGAYFWMKSKGFSIGQGDGESPSERTRYFFHRAGGRDATINNSENRVACNPFNIRTRRL